MRPSPMLAEHEAIDLGSIGGTISTVYVDIACVPVPATQVRAKTPAVSRPPSPPAPAPADSPPPSSLRSPAPQPAPAPAPATRPQRQPAAPGGQNGQRPATRPRRGGGNGAAPPERKALRSIHGVAKNFVGRNVVSGVSLYVRKGEGVGLFGTHGVGNNTVIYMITGLIKAYDGRLEHVRFEYL